MDFEIVGEITKMESQNLSAQHFALCLNNQEYPISLQVGKLYQIIPDPDAEAHG